MNILKWSTISYQVSIVIKIVIKCISNKQTDLKRWKLYRILYFILTHIVLDVRILYFMLTHIVVEEYCTHIVLDVRATSVGE